MSEQYENSAYFGLKRSYQLNRFSRSMECLTASFEESRLVVVGKTYFEASPDLCWWIFEGINRYRYTWSVPNLGDHIAFSPDKELLAFNSDTNKLSIRTVNTHKVMPYVLDIAHPSDITCIAWSPDGKSLASGSLGRTICIWDTQTGRLQKFIKTRRDISHISWSPNGKMIAYANASDMVCPYCNYMVRGGSNCPHCGNKIINTDNDFVVLWNTTVENVLITINRVENDYTTCIAWSSDSQMLAIGLSSYAILLHQINGHLELSLEGMPSKVTQIYFAAYDTLLIALCEDASVYFWNIEASKGSILLVPSVNVESANDESRQSNGSPSLAEKHTLPLGLFAEGRTVGLITYNATNNEISFWDFDVDRLKSQSFLPSEQYTNAKVVLVGDSGVGKSGLGLVLTRQDFAPTESTHGRHVWTLNDQEITMDDGSRERREILLWDLAGQPGYRLIHQLHLSDASVALVVFDAHSETDPFSGVSHWARALRIVQKAQNNNLQNMKILLVAARIDRSTIGVSRERINKVLRQFGFDGYFETSAKSGKNIKQLLTAVMGNITWESLPKVTSSSMFQTIRSFLIEEKEDGRLLVTSDELFRTFIHAHPGLRERKNLRPQFDVCVGRMESKGLLRRLSFGDLLLLQPEILDAYASALINAVKDEPDGLGGILEEQVRKAHFEVSHDERIADLEQEKLLLIAMIEDLFRYEVALREDSNDGAYLVFPTQSTRENPDLPSPEGKSIIFEFEGPVQNIYATLAVRLSHSGLFRKQELWKNAITYTAIAGGMYGLYLHNVGEGRGELTLFFDDAALEPLCFHFEEYVRTHLLRRALPDTIQRRRIFVCSGCAIPLSDLHVVKRRERGLRWMTCGICDAKVDLSDGMERLTGMPQLHSQISDMDRSADIERNRSTIVSILQGKLETNDFDVFLCHNSEDKPFVKEIGEQLKVRGLLPWLDEWNLRPGLPWQRALEEHIDMIKSAAVFVGKDGIGPWQRMELEAFLRKFVNTGRPVIPVLLSNVEQEPRLPTFLEGMTWVDFRVQNPNPMVRLIWGITGKPQET